MGYHQCIKRLNVHSAKYIDSAERILYEIGRDSIRQQFVSNYIMAAMELQFEALNINEMRDRLKRRPAYTYTRKFNISKKKI